MSYINDALRRLQKEKGSPYEAYSHLLRTAEKKPRHYSIWSSLVGIFIVFCFAVAMSLFLNSLDNIKAEFIPSSVVLKGPPVARKPVTIENKAQQLKKQIEYVPQEVNKQAGKSDRLYAQALQKHSQGKLEEAKRLYRKVITIDQNNLHAMNNLGVIYMAQKDYKRAIKYFNEALDINSKYVDAHYNLACVYAQKKDKEQSIFYLKNAIGFNSQARLWAKSDVDLKPLHNLPEFISLMKEQGNKNEQ